MSWMKWLPWRYLVKRMAHRHGFLDPIALLAKLHSFAQPSEVGEPIELLRAGVAFHARGLINSRVIQHNLDWVWPYWVERQFDPNDVAFIPRAFSITHINLSNRNWTAVGQPDIEALPVVDPRGLLTPLYDGWSLDGWLLADDGRCLLPSRCKNSRQWQELGESPCVVTESEMDGLKLTSRAQVVVENGRPVCQLVLRGQSDVSGSLVLSLRPANPEGVAFIHRVSLAESRDAWQVEGIQSVFFSQPARSHHVSDYKDGDVRIHLADKADQTEGQCDVGMVTAAALFPIEAGKTTELTITVPLTKKAVAAAQPESWQKALDGYTRLECPDKTWQFLYDAAIRSLVLHSPGDVYPGPYTYKRFWFRDAAFIIHALLCSGMTERAERALNRFPHRQLKNGYFRSQEGEWDANGEVLWILQRFHEMTGRKMSIDWFDPVSKGARWIQNKRLSGILDKPHAGLLPAGFSAEHLGPNDYYYWDDFWGIAGLKAASQMLRADDQNSSDTFAAGAREFTQAVDRSLASCERRLKRPGMPASPYRRMDAGAIGSLAMGYPTQLCRPDDPRLLDCVEFLLENCFVKGAFYQDMIHSGLNAYLTLHVAQVLLRAGDPRFLELMDSVAGLASPTGQWPEAIHPGTGGGCMGDGHHVWASAEWVLMVRNCFVREEGDRLILCAGIPPRWLEQDKPIRFGPAPTTFGAISITIQPCRGSAPHVTWEGDWHTDEPVIEVRLPA
ncbi:hypothetical protein BKP64_01240 [Marinobacter salinus]|uniref:Uncharacterized protein n=1 Tax=Marinobacter salinus TaxID=1874317 RepID=A0A1D9GHQ3_9GAMM|nr:hypothetical protein [Marinobacter salinus]AOY86910.1 hypothetical protein BKP64_01240 [Marinobacter salinus]